MRTTVTLDEDVAAQVKELVTKEKKPFKQVINELLRMALLSRRELERKKKSKYSTPTLEVGPCKLPDLDNVSEVLSIAEGENYS